MKAKILYFIPVLVILFSSCGKDGMFGIKGSGSMETETRNLHDFSKIDLSIDADVTIVYDDDYFVEIEAQGNIIDNLITQVSNDKLKIKNDRNVRKHNGIYITVHMPVISGVDISGSGTVVSNDHFNTNELFLDISGSGSIDLSNINVKYEIDSDISGSGSIYIAGDETANYSFTKISGSGSYNAFNHKVKNVKVKISGSGDCRVNALDQLNVDISGSGSVYYIGHPSINSDISGSGRIISSN